MFPRSRIKVRQHLSYDFLSEQYEISLFPSSVSNKLVEGWIEDRALGNKILAFGANVSEREE